MRKASILSVIIVTLLCSCFKDDKLCPDDQPITTPCDSLISFLPFQDTCFTIPPPPGGMWLEESGHYNFFQGSINPSNPNQFLFYMNKILEDDGYWIVDICTGEQNKFLDDFNPLYGQPKWGLNGWIVFATQHKKLMKIKSNGDSLTALVPELKCESPNWMPESRNIICLSESEMNPGSFMTAIIDLNGTVVDSLTPYLLHSVHNNKIAVYTGLINGNEIGYLDVSNDYTYFSTTTLTSENSTPTSIDWLDEKHIIWTDKLGLHKVNIEIGQATTLRENCDNRRYSSISTYPEYNGVVLMNEAHTEPIDENKKRILHRIFKYDTNTDEQWLIDLEP